MDRKKALVVGGIVVLMGVVFITLNGMNEPAPAPVAPEREVIVEKVEYAKVLGVVDAMQKGARISADDLTWIDWPAEAVTPALIVDDPEAEIPVIDQLDGSIVRDPITPGEPLTYSKFIRAGEAGIMAALLRPGMRAVTIRISVDTAAGGFIQPGDKVDIILKEVLPASSNPNGSDRPEIVANTVFKNVSVLAIDQSFTNNPEGGAAIPGSTATLELSPRDAEDLLVAQDRGDISLVLRGFSGANARAASRASEPRAANVVNPPLTVYRQGDVETVQLQTR